MHLRPNHANSHDIRKGDAAQASSATMCLPPVPSIAAHGEWSLGRFWASTGILHCANDVNEKLPSSFCSEMDKFLKSFRKETANAKKSGLVDEQEADPISFTLFHQLLVCGVDRRTFFMWVFAFLQ